MGIYRTPIKPITPTKPRSANLTQSPPTMNTWYTVVDVLSGRGILSRISLFYSNATNESQEVRITIDGESYSTSGGASTSVPSTSRTFSHYSASSSGSSTDLWLNTAFKSSLKIEIRQTKFSSAGTLEASVDYSIE